MENTAVKVDTRKMDLQTMGQFVMVVRFHLQVGVVEMTNIQRVQKEVIAETMIWQVIITARQTLRILLVKIKGFINFIPF